MHFLDGLNKSTGQPYGPIQYTGQIACPGVVLGYAEASGIQIYVAAPNKDTHELEWSHRGPAASLAMDDGTDGDHGKTGENPYWSWNGDGGSITARKVAWEPASETDIDWLRLDKVDASGNFQRVSHIQRVECRGGKPHGLPLVQGETQEIPYSARYIFIGDEVMVGIPDDAV